MKKIIHLSDPHLGYEDCGERLQCLLGSLILAKQPASNYVIIITGDLVESAKSANYRKARAQVERLEKEGYTVLVIPGNHDYGTGIIANKKHVPVFKETFFGTTDITYPKLDIIDGVAFIGLDSMAEELHWYDRMWANGELGKDQLARLDVILSDTAVAQCTHRVVYLHHHPFDPLPLHELGDSKDLGELLQKHGNVSALLFGHNHHGKIWNGVWGIPRCYDAGTTTHKDNYPGYHRVMDLGRDPRLDYDGNFHCIPRGFLGLRKRLDDESINV